MGSKEWGKIAKELPNKTARQCKERWASFLAPDILYVPWSPEEDKLLIEEYNKHGREWSKIAKYLNGKRTSISIKNRFVFLNRKGLPDPFQKQTKKDTGEHQAVTTKEAPIDFNCELKEKEWSFDFHDLPNDFMDEFMCNK